MSAGSPACDHNATATGAVRGDAAILAAMARNSENAPSEPSGRRRKPPEGGSRLREHFRDSIRDALSGVDVDELQGRRIVRVPSDVSLLTREAVTDLEVELAKLRAERAELERRAAERAGGGAAVAVEVEAPPEVAVAEAAPPAPVEPEALEVAEAPESAEAPRRGRLPWRRARPAAVEVEREEAAPGVPDGNGAAVAGSAVAWSPARAMQPVEDRVAEAPVEAAPAEPTAAEGIPPAHGGASVLVDGVAPAPESSPALPTLDAAPASPAAAAPAPVEEAPPEVALAAPEAPTEALLAAPEAPTEWHTAPPEAPAAPSEEETAPRSAAPAAPTTPTAPPSKRPTTPAAPRRRAPQRRPSQLTDAELESVVAPLLAELANLRAEVRQLRGDPDDPAPLRAPGNNRQLAKLAAGLLLGFALIVVALAVVLKA